MSPPLPGELRGRRHRDPCSAVLQPDCPLPTGEFLSVSAGARASEGGACPSDTAAAPQPVGLMLPARWPVGLRGRSPPAGMGNKRGEVGRCCPWS